MIKDVPRRQLIEVVRTVAEGDSLLAPAITRKLIEAFVHRPPPTTGVPPRLEDLSERELDVVRLLVRGHNNQEIAEELYLGEATIETHLGRIFTELAKPGNENQCRIPAVTSATRAAVLVGQVARAGQELMTCLGGSVSWEGSRRWRAANGCHWWQRCEK